MRGTGAEPRPRLTAASLCAEYAERVYRYAAIVSKRDTEVDDLAHDAMVRAIQHVDEYDPRRGSVEAWLWRIVTNKAKDSARAQARRILLWARLLWAPGNAASVEDHVIERLTISELLLAIRQLPASDRQLLGLRFGAGLSFMEIALATNTTEAAAGVATRRAIAKLRKKLEGWVNEK
jgi:RNA polymerase sigma-70 factor (ECF subfamily)